MKRLYIVYLVMGFLVCSSTSIFSQTFDVWLKSQQKLTVPDTIGIRWIGLGSGDSLKVTYDMLSYPDFDTIGVKILPPRVFTSSDTVIVAKVMPEEDFIWFSLFKKSSGIWSRVGTDSLYIQGFDYEYPKVGYTFNGLNMSYFMGDTIKRVARLDIGWDGDTELGGSGTSNVQEKRDRLDSLSIYNPDFIEVLHSDIQLMNLRLTAPVYQDTIGTVVADSIQSLLFSVPDTIEYLYNDSTVLMRASGSGRFLKVNDASMFPPPDGGDGITYGSHRPFIQIKKNEWCRVDKVWDNSGTGNDSLYVIRSWQNGSYPATSWPNGSTVYYLQSSAEQGGRVYSSWEGILLKGLEGDGAIHGVWPYELKASLEINTIEKVLSSRNTLLCAGVNYDTYFYNHVGKKGESSDSALIRAASMFQSQNDSLIYLSVNARGMSFMGIEDSLVQIMNLAEIGWGGSPWDLTNGRWAGNYRDDLDNLLELTQAKRYRYASYSNNYLPQLVSASNEKDAIRSERFNLGLMTIFGGNGMTKMKYAKPHAVWGDEYFVDSNGISTNPDSVGPNRWWLGQPVDKWRPLLLNFSKENKITNGTFDVNLSGWSVSGSGVPSDSISISRVTDVVKSGSGAMKIQINVNRRDGNINVPENDFYDFAVGSNTFSLNNQAEYTLKFDARSIDSKLIGVRIHSNRTLYRVDCVHIPKMWRTVYIPVEIDTNRTSGLLTNVQVEFGITPILRNNESRSIWIDNVELIPSKTAGDSLGFIGYQRVFEHGWVGVNLREQDTVKVDVPGPDSTYRKIQAARITDHIAYVWSDSAHNDYSIVNDSLKIPFRDSYFLYGLAPVGDVLPPDMVGGVSIDSVGTTWMRLHWNKGDSLDIAGYMIKANVGLNNAPVNYQSGQLWGTTSSRLDTTFRINGLNSSENYSVSVFAFDESNNYSNLGSGSWADSTTLELSYSSFTVGERGSSDYKGRTFDTFTKDGSDRNTNYGRNATILVKNDPGPDSTFWRYGYSQFDLSGLVHPYDIIDSSFVKYNFVSGGQDTIVLYACIDSWVDSLATWASPMGNTIKWDSGGGRGSAIDSIYLSSYGEYKFDVTALMRKVIKGQTVPIDFLNVQLWDVHKSPDSHAFASSEYLDQAKRPELVVYFSKGDSLAPDNVLGVDTTSVGFTSIDLVWNKGDSLDIAGYVATYLQGSTAPTSRSQGVVAQDSSLSRSDTSLVITGLDSASTYSVSVFAFDENQNYSVADSLGRSSVTVNTHGNWPPNPAQGVQLINATETSLDVIFKRNQDSDLKGYAGRYKVGFEQYPPSKDSGTVIVDSSLSRVDTTMTINGLLAGQYYSVSVFPFDSLMQYADTTGSNGGAYATEQTLNRVYPDPVTNVDTLEVGSSSVNLIFSQGDSADIAGYVVRYKQGTIPVWGIMDTTGIAPPESSVAKADTQIVVTGLDIKTIYSFTVFAYNTFGNYSDTTRTSYITGIETHGAPGKPKVEDRIVW